MKVIKPLRDVIKRTVNEALLEFHGNQTLAAKALKITRNTLRSYMDERFKALGAERGRISQDVRKLALVKRGLLPVKSLLTAFPVLAKGETFPK